MCHRNRRNPLFQDVYDRKRQIHETKVTNKPLSFEDPLRMNKLCTSSMLTTLDKIYQIVSKELKVKQATPYENVLEEDTMNEIKVTPSNPKWKLKMKGSPNPSEEILGNCRNFNKIKRQKIERGILGSKPSEAPQSMKNHEALKASQKNIFGPMMKIKDNPLFEVDMTNKGEINSGVSWRDKSVSPLKGYYDDTLFKDKTLFLEDDSTSIENDSVQKEGSTFVFDPGDELGVILFSKIASSFGEVLTWDDLVYNMTLSYEGIQVFLDLKRGFVFLKIWNH
ncbi:hypothetical protein FXO38_33645 [Capsicum annuum]|nr:hypothetical protein FXO38_33645 [Capsicum annuum]